VSPYLNQAEPASAKNVNDPYPPAMPRRLEVIHRDIVALLPIDCCAELAPLVARHYPVFILAHHLVTDRVHRMGRIYRNLLGARSAFCRNTIEL